MSAAKETRGCGVARALALVLAANVARAQGEQTRLEFGRKIWPDDGRQAIKSRLQNLAAGFHSRVTLEAIAAHLGVEPDSLYLENDQ